MLCVSRYGGVEGDKDPVYFIYVFIYSIASMMKRTIADILTWRRMKSCV